MMKQAYLGCTPWEVSVNAHAIQSKAGSFKRLTTAGETEERDLTKEPLSSKQTTARSYDMQGHAEKCVERNCELGRKSASSLQQVTTPCIGGRLLPPEDFEPEGELGDVCAQ